MKHHTIKSIGSFVRHFHPTFGLVQVQIMKTLVAKEADDHISNEIMP
jgi:hypothetical protein